MLFALTKAFHVFDPKALLKDTAKVAVATLTIVAAGILALHACNPVHRERAHCGSSKSRVDRPRYPNLSVSGISLVGCYRKQKAGQF